MEDAVVFPTGYILGDTSAPYVNAENGEPKWRGAIQISQDLQLSLLEDLCDEIARNGFTKICLFSAHGGNAWLLPQFLKRQA